LRLWADGDYAGATEASGRTATENPRGGLAVQFAHIGDFAFGCSHMLRDRIARVLPRWRAAPGEGFILGMRAFGRGDHAEAVARLLPVRGKANRFGDSHARRDVFSWTLMEAALRPPPRTGNPISKRNLLL